MRPVSSTRSSFVCRSSGISGDLVEQQRSSGCALEIALVLAHCASERAALVSEQLRLDEVRRNGAAVDGDHRPIRARAVVVQKLGGELLAGAGLADEHHGHLRRRDAPQLGFHLKHLGGLADELVALTGPRRGRAASARRPGRKRKRRDGRRRRRRGRYGSRKIDE
jgi:hypothetical protein